MEELVYMNDQDKEGAPTISAPWIAYAHKVIAAFGDDPEIAVDIGDADVSEGFLTIEIICTNYVKYKALQEIVNAPDEISGVRIDMRFTYTGTDRDKRTSLYEAALRGNPYFNSVIQLSDPRDENVKYTFALFNNEVVQYFDDDISDYYGCNNMVPEDLFREILKDDPEIRLCQVHKDTDDEQVDG